MDEFRMIAEQSSVDCWFVMCGSQKILFRQSGFCHLFKCEALARIPRAVSCCLIVERLYRFRLLWSRSLFGFLCSSLGIGTAESIRVRLGIVSVGPEFPGFGSICLWDVTEVEMFV